ncbi:hypothetical protein [Acinetobacter populi]|uniref:Uncharacterized protein n=1 Tax=Acinetobacter populi TaxID=1582270 RepID=A0A1Z9YZ05_9GAMM|nr:hypothetical protein [Acinetobacter populi]OUY07438.1 hypothetical protein CAP51_06690 [Acinetobacter populi]
MSLKCPFCQSEQVVLIENNPSPTNAMASMASPATLAALGATVAKSFNLPPLVGGVAGTVLGGLVNILTEPEPLQPISLCFCQHCYQRFPSTLLQQS